MPPFYTKSIVNRNANGAVEPMSRAIKSIPKSVYYDFVEGDR